MIRRRKSRNDKTGFGLVNSLINNLPFEAHLPGYQYLGPGTRLAKRLARGDPGINGLDAACREHDIAYSTYKDIKNRHSADKVLENRAWERVKAKDSSFGEKAAAYAVTNVMKVKRKLGMGVGFNSLLKAGRKAIRKTAGKNVEKIADLALAAARSEFKKAKRKPKAPRIVRVPKIGGVIPLIPIFAGLSALGSLAGGSANIIRAINEVRRNSNTKTPIKVGSGLYLHPVKSKKGSGLYLKPYSKN